MDWTTHFQSSNSWDCASTQCNRPATQPVTLPQTYYVKQEHDQPQWPQPNLESAFWGLGIEQSDSSASNWGDFPSKPSVELPPNLYCNTCGMTFARSHYLKVHMTTHRPQWQRPFGCGYSGCSRRFLRQADLCRHEQSVRLCDYGLLCYTADRKQVHRKERNFTCPLCGGTFTRKDTLTR